MFTILTSQLERFTPSSDCSGTVYSKSGRFHGDQAFLLTYGWWRI